MDFLILLVSKAKFREADSSHRSKEQEASGQTGSVFVQRFQDPDELQLARSQKRSGMHKVLAQGAQHMERGMAALSMVYVIEVRC